MNSEIVLAKNDDKAVKLLLVIASKYQTNMGKLMHMMLFLEESCKKHSKGTH